jgi:hypothetical protein
LFAALVACGGATVPSSDTTKASDGGDSGSRGEPPDSGVAPNDAGNFEVPPDHRPAPVPCAPIPLPPEPALDAGLGPSPRFDCQRHADCVARPGGRCVAVPPDPPVDPGGTRCFYDECHQDGDCAAGSVCACGPMENLCLAGNCRVDADCGPNGYCSPGVDADAASQGCGNLVPRGYHCHTPGDACILDRDCPGGPVGQPLCAINASGKWTCVVTYGCGMAAHGD